SPGMPPARTGSGQPCPWRAWASGHLSRWDFGRWPGWLQMPSGQGRRWSGAASCSTPPHVVGGVRGQSGWAGPSETREHILWKDLSDGLLIVPGTFTVQSEAEDGRHSLPVRHPVLIMGLHAATLAASPTAPCRD